MNKLLAVFPLAGAITFGGLTALAWSCIDLAGRRHEPIEAVIFSGLFLFTLSITLGMIGAIVVTLKDSDAATAENQ